jgi:hypothetical protein
MSVVVFWTKNANGVTPNSTDICGETLILWVQNHDPSPQQWLHLSVAPRNGDGKLRTQKIMYKQFAPKFLDSLLYTYLIHPPSSVHWDLTKSWVSNHGSLSLLSHDQGDWSEALWVALITSWLCPVSFYLETIVSRISSKCSIHHHWPYFLSTFAT